MVTEFKTTVTQSTMLCNLPGMAIQVYCLVIPDATLAYFIYQELSHPPVVILFFAMAPLTRPGLC